MVKRLFRLIAAAALTASFLAAPANAYAKGGPKQITLIDYGEKSHYVTSAETVKDFYDEIGVTLTPKDKSVPGYAHKITSNLTVEIKRGYHVYVIIDGVRERIKVARDIKAGEFIEFLIDDRGVEFLFNGSYSDVLQEWDTLYLYSQEESTITTTYSYPFETEYVEVGFISRGEHHLYRPGIEGAMEKVERVIFDGGEQVSKEIIETRVLVPAINEIIYVGAADPEGDTGPDEQNPEEAAGPEPEEARNREAETAGPDDADKNGDEIDPGLLLNAETEQNLEIEGFKYVEVYTMSSTAYNIASLGKAPGSRGYGLTASGRRVARGLVAVDRELIPLGTKLYVEGYGFAIAADTGPGVKGLKIDLYVETLEEAKAYGRKDVKVYILED